MGGWNPKNESKKTSDMLSLYRTLSLRYLSRRWFRAMLIVASIMLGVGTLVATQALSETMSKATLAAGNPMAGTIDFIITNGEFPIELSLVKELQGVPGVKEVDAKIFGQARIVIGEKKIPVMVMGFDMRRDAKKASAFEEHFRLDQNETELYGRLGAIGALNEAAVRFGMPEAVMIPAILGKQLDIDLANEPTANQAGHKQFDLEKKKRYKLTSIAAVEPKASNSNLAAFAGYLVILDMTHAAEVLGVPAGKVKRIDIALQPGTDAKKARANIEEVLKNRAHVRTMEEQNQSLQSAMVGMKTGFSMCGVAALIVGMFLVYNALSVSVAERRHEIGILLAVGATRTQVWRLFAGEAIVLGALGAALGIPFGVGFAYIGLQPMQDAVGDIFATMNTKQVELTWDLSVLATCVGILSALVASLKPAVQAAYEKPAEAVRRTPKEQTMSHLLLHIGATCFLILGGMAMIFCRDLLPKRWGTYGGLSMVMIGALLSAPLCAQITARMLMPISRRFFPIEWRIAADNLIRAPGRTGMVIAALAAGVCLIVETAGIIRSNRETIMTWVDDTISADVIVTSGSPVGSGGQNTPMEEALGDALRKLPEVEEVTPVRFLTGVPFRHDQVAIMTTVADRHWVLDQKRLTHLDHLDLYKRMEHEPNTVIVSANFSALHHVHKGDTITLKSPRGDATFLVIGTIVDYSWNLGTIFMNRKDYIHHWNDTTVNVFDVYVKSTADPSAVKDKIIAKLGAQHDLHALTRKELKDHIKAMIEKLYSIALGQEIVVVLVAALGVITALLISVLQRRREMGLLRAIGASQAQVVYLVLAEACLMGIIGSVLGVLFAIPLQWYALQIVFLEEAGYTFPMYLPWAASAAIALSAMLVATLAGLGPALYAVRERIPNAIAYE